jgi:hypothetical protein
MLDEAGRKRGADGVRIPLDYVAAGDGYRRTASDGILATVRTQDFGALYQADLTLGDGQQSVGHRRRATAGGATTVLGKVEGVTCRPEQVVVTGGTESHKGAVGLAQEYCAATSFHTFAENAVRIDHVVLERA